MKNLPKQSLPPAHDTLHGVHIVWRRAHGRNGLACWLAIPHQRRADTPALVAIHGIQRGAEEMARSFAARAAAEGRVVIAPVFDEAGWTGYQRVVQRRRADLALIALLDELALEGLVGKRPFTLFGFSGGAQFAHRFAMLYPHRIDHLIAAAAGWYTLPDRHSVFPYGLGAESGRQAWGPKFGAALDRFLQLPVSVLVGTLDNLPDETTRSTPELDRRQGRDRLTRARTWTRALTHAARARGLATRIRLHTLAACGHRFIDCVRDGGLVDHVFAPPVPLDACTTALAA